ncbi:hypothetical protein SCHPADRAFT_911880 [Schizopora paradoxa]|uniref:Secreted protein n=1 Tax=Schizopora paradoxa TaxID=27342 RepID=A0A0H2QWY0_9AGAM|nr:hypothetical protein SCHPADRAFT_911880 [Schizopora paradoxa]
MHLIFSFAFTAVISLQPPMSSPNSTQYPRNSNETQRRIRNTEIKSKLINLFAVPVLALWNSRHQKFLGQRRRWHCKETETHPHILLVASSTPPWFPICGMQAGKH